MFWALNGATERPSFARVTAEPGGDGALADVARRAGDEDGPGHQFLLQRAGPRVFRHRSSNQFKHIRFTLPIQLFSIDWCEADKLDVVYPQLLNRIGLNIGQ